MNPCTPPCIQVEKLWHEGGNASDLETYLQLCVVEIMDQSQRTLFVSGYAAVRRPRHMTEQNLLGEHLFV